jgi:hypothetical protein
MAQASLLIDSWREPAWIEPPLPHDEKPDEFNRLLTAFLDRIEFGAQLAGIVKH